MVFPEDRIEKWLQDHEANLTDPARNKEALKEAWKMYRDAETDAQTKEKLATAIDFMINKL